MKKSLLFLFLLILGVTQGRAYDELTSAVTVNADKVYQVTASRTINGTITVNSGKTLTIYIAKGKTLTVNADNSTSQTGASPAIAVPKNAILIVTGAGTLKVRGGKAAPYKNGYGGGAASPAIGGVGGNGAPTPTAGGDMGTVYVRGNVTVRAARGTSYGRKATSKHGADGGIPTYAIGGGGGGGANTGAGKTNGNVGGNGYLFVEKSARVIYLNGKRRIGNTVMTPIQKGNANTVSVTYTDYDNSTKKDVDLTPSAIGQTITEYGFININNDKYYSRISTPVESPDPDTGFEQVKITTKKVKNWTTSPNGQGTVYNPKDLVLADGTGEGVAQKKTLKLYANWEENSAVTFNVIHNAEELMKFARMVNGTGEYESNAIEDANGILMADIDMDKYTWVPIGATNDKYMADDHTKRFRGIFDGNGHIVSNIKMANPVGVPGIYVRDNKKPEETEVTANWRVAYDRAGLIGFAEGATIKNVVVKNAIIYAKWQAAVVCGRLGDTAFMENCGSYGDLSLGLVEITGTQGENDYAGFARVIAGVVITEKPNNVTSVWSTYAKQRSDAPSKTASTVDGVNAKYHPSHNYVVGLWNNKTTNDTYVKYTQNTTTYETANAYRKWVYVPSDKSSWLAKGQLCLALNGNVDGATAWTQTFNKDDNTADTCRYVQCPRPTSRGLAVYKDADDAYTNHIYTVSFDANGGKENPADIYVRRVYNATTRTLSSESLPGAPTLEEGEIYVFNGWWTDPDGDTEVKSLSVETINSDMTLYAHWLAGPESISVKAVEDAKNPGNYYSTFYYGEQDYQIKTDNVVAYKAYRKKNDAGEVIGNDLIMMTLKDKQQHISKVIPAGEAVILKANGTPKQGSLIINLAAVSSTENDPELDENNILYGSDEQINVTDVNDMITTNQEPTDPAKDAQTYSNCYVFAFGSNTGLLGFYKPSGSTLAAHKAYALLNDQIIVSGNTGSGSAKAESLQMIFEDDEEQVTGISEHKSESETKKAIFSINGMPLSKLQKGINIVGGKKVFVK